MCRLPDGSYLAYLPVRRRHRRGARREPLLVRFISYTLTDPAWPGPGQIYRLVTTLLDPDTAPALELACAYHEHWEVELVIDDLDTHERLADRPLNSLTPVGVIQELYALVPGHYAVRALMHEGTLAQGLDSDRLSFVHALWVPVQALPEFQMTCAAQVERLYQRLIADIGADRIPEGRLRISPRVVKREMPNCRLKQPGQKTAPQPTIPLHQAVVLI